MEEVTRQEFNGLGGRVTNLAVDKAACRAEILQKYENQEQQMTQTRENVSKLFTKVDSVTGMVNRGIGIMIAVSAAIALVGVILEHVWK